MNSEVLMYSASAVDIATIVIYIIYLYSLVPFKYFNMFITLFQSLIVGFSQFLAAICTANVMFGLVYFDKNIIAPMALLYIVLLNSFLFSF